MSDRMHQAFQIILADLIHDAEMSRDTVAALKGVTPENQEAWFEKIVKKAKALEAFYLTSIPEDD